MKCMVRILLGSVLCGLAACSRPAADKELDLALQLAEGNRSELEAVLNHYKDDSLKYEAARFLIRNMPYHYGQKDYYLSPEGDEYRPDITAFADKEAMQLHCDSLTRNGYRLMHENLYDVLTLDSAFLVRNIDQAFKAWHKPWAKRIPFDIFCRYILPYRAQTEEVADLRGEMMECFLPLLDTADVRTPLEACTVLNEQLKEVIRYRDPGFTLYPTLRETYRAGFSACEGICNLGTCIMRAVGIPVAVDITLWPKMDLGHSWCAVWDNGRFYSFGPGEEQPDIHAEMLVSKRHRRPAKVYRRRFAPTHYGKQTADDGKTWLDSPLLEDVTCEYLDKPTTIRVPVSDREGVKASPFKKVYLCVYNYYEWRPLAIGACSEEGIAKFTDVVGDNIFIVARNTADGAWQYVSAPFHADRQGKIHMLVPDLENRETATLKRQKAGTEHTLYYWDTKQNTFVPIPCQSSTDTTQTYNQLPKDALLWLVNPQQKTNQVLCFLQNDSVMHY